jgi:hypothetical protein
MRYSDRHDGEFYINLKGVLYMYKIPNSDEYFKSYDVMLCTGLRDIHDKEIYEGDIVNKIDTGVKYIVKMHKGSFRLFNINETLNNMSWCEIPTLEEMLFFVEVVANTYEIG